MDTKLSSVRAWEWATEWRWTTQFWVVASLVGVGTGTAAYLVSNNWSVAGIFLALGAVVTFPFGYMWKWATLHLQDQEELRIAVARLAEADQAREASATSERNPGSTIRPQFEAYVDQQLERLQRLPDLIRESDTGWASGEWDEFVKLAWRTASGIRRFDDDLGDYVTATITEAEWEFTNELVRGDTKGLLVLADRIIETVGDTKRLFHG